MSGVKHTEQDLRRAKDVMLRVLSDQQRDLGVPDPGGLNVERFIAPIMQKLDGETVSDAPSRDHGKAPGIDARRAAKPERTEKSYLGTYEWHGDHVVALDDSWKPPTFEELGPADRMRQIVRRLLTFPKWERAFKKAGLMCSKHTLPVRLCVPCERREERMRELFAKAFKEYGHPLRRERKRLYSK